MSCNSMHTTSLACHTAIVYTRDHREGPRPIVDCLVIGEDETLERSTELRAWRSAD